MYTGAKQSILKFRTHLPVLHTLCNPGLRNRHWDAIADANGSPINYDDNTSLHDMIEAGLNRIVEQLCYCARPLGQLFWDPAKRNEAVVVLLWAACAMS